MADYLLDTNILSYWYNESCPQHQRVVARVDAARRPDPRTHYVSRFFISVVTLGEIQYGHRVNPTPDAAKQTEFSRFVEEQCPVSKKMIDHVAEQYGELRAWLFNNCGPRNRRSKVKRAEELVNPTTGKELGIDENDLWIAAQARTFNLVLVTNDTRGNFGQVLVKFAPTLKVENWTE